MSSAEERNDGLAEPLRIVGVGTWWLVMDHRHQVRGQFKSKGRAEDYIREDAELAKALTTVQPLLDYCEHGYSAGEHCRTCEIMEVCKACLRHECPTCHGQRTIAVAGPDSFGMYDTDDCPTCSQEPRPGYCKHGVYVGGIGVDWMCGRCEDGQ